MSIEILTEQILDKIPQIGKWQRKFILHLFPLWFKLRGRYNFVHLARYGEYIEDSYRNNFARNFDFLTFNQKLVEQSLSSDRILAFDPVFIPKSGKHTPGAGYFYSGCAGREQWGLEFSGIAAIDLSDKTALHLQAVQTLEHSDSLLDYYASHILKNTDQLKSISEVLAADAYFAKAPFINALTDAGFEVVTRLRKDSRLRYLYHGPKRRGRGRPKTYDGRIDPMRLRDDQFSVCAKDEDGSWIAYEAIVNVKAWKRNVRLVVEHSLDEKAQLKSYKLYVCTDLSMPGGDLKHAYNCRYQIEFLYRDSKQHAGLSQCQARSEEKLFFHLNTALTCVSLAKAAFHIPVPIEKRKPFSMADIKNAYANDFIFDRIISMFGFCPNLTFIKSIRENIRALGKITA